MGSALFVYAAYLYLLLGAIALNSPLVEATLFIGFRAIFGAGAWNKVTIFGLPYFLPAVGMVTLAAAYSLWRGRSFTRLSGVFKIYMVFLYAVGFAAILKLETATATADVTVKLVCSIAIYFLVLQGIREEADINRALRLLMYTSFVPFGFGAYEFITGSVYAFDFEEESLTQMAGSRITGTVIDANIYGMYASLVLFVALPLLIRERSKDTLLFIGLTLFALITSKNRGTWIALFVSLGLAVFFFRMHLRVLYWISAAAASVAVALPVMLTRFAELHELDEYGQSQDTFAGRLQHHAALLQKSFDNPLFGSGLGSSFPTETSPGFIEDVYPHNDYLRIAVDSGYIALLLFLAFLVAQAVRSWALRFSPRWDIQFAAFAAQIYIIIIISVENFFPDLLLFSCLMYLLAVSHRASAFGDNQPMRQPRANGLRAGAGQDVQLTS